MPEVMARALGERSRRVGWHPSVRFLSGSSIPFVVSGMVLVCFAFFFGRGGGERICSTYSTFLESFSADGIAAP